MARTKAPRATRHVAPGAPRASEPGSALDCLLLAPAPDWVAVDLATGALVRGSLSAREVPEELGAGPLASLRLVLGPLEEPWDPSRPEAVAAREASSNRPPAKRAVRRLLALLARPEQQPGLLGGVGPSLPYVDLGGDRPSVVVLAPADGRVHLTGDEALVAHFRLAQQVHALPVAPGAVGWLRSGRVPTASSRAPAGRTRLRGRGSSSLSGLEPTVPVLLVAGLAAPVGGQVRKVVLGVVPDL